MILVGIVNSLLTAVIVVGWMSANGGFAGYSVGGSWAARAVSALLTSAISLAYFTLMESRTGKTLGKMLLKLETHGAAGGMPTVEEALKRNLWVAIGVIGVLPFLGWLSGPLELAAVIAIMVTISSSPTKQGWHDRWAGTQVVRTG